MENLPKNVINKTMLFTSHPVADILRETTIFRALKMDGEERIRGSPFDRGDADAYYGRGYEPHKRGTLDGNIGTEQAGRIVKLNLSSNAEIEEYDAAYLHSWERRNGRNSAYKAIFKKYRYYKAFCIRPLWCLAREEQECDDRIYSEDEDSSDEDLFHSV